MGVGYDSSEREISCVAVEISTSLDYTSRYIALQYEYARRRQI